MGTNKAEIAEWFDEGIEQGARYMLVVCDTFDYEDYPSFYVEESVCIEKMKSPGSMQRVMECYDLSGDKDAQLKLPRCWALERSQ